MLYDDEYEEMLKSPERFKALGFQPQKETLMNHALPYADELDEESTRFLKEVKTNLAKAVILREMKPACGVWTSRLMKYLRIYGLKFSKEDHIAFIKLAFELVLIPDLEPCKIHKFATLFVVLTKKRNLISPSELSLPWRPLYELGKRISEKNYVQIGLYHYLPRQCDKKKEVDMISMIRNFLSGPGLGEVLNLFGFAENDEGGLPTSLEGSYSSMVKCAKPYFPVSATKEILAELLPQINPWTSDMYVTSQLIVFLPVSLEPKYAAQGHELWFDELMNLWDSCNNSQCGVWDFLNIFAGLAKRNPGAVDWSPHVPKFFSRFLYTFNLPVSYRNMHVTQQHLIDTKQLATWIVWSICPDGVVLKHLRSFLGGVESYLQSANSGRWSYKLRDLLRKLAREFWIRVRRENEKVFKESWENQTPEHYKLRDEDITEFVNILYEPILQTVYSRNGSSDISAALQFLALLRPAIVIPTLIERLLASLTSLTEPHKVTAAMTVVAAVARPLLLGRDFGYPEGPTHVVPLLMAVLPGLDPNDIRKTLTTMHFILMFSLLVPFIDCSSAHEHWPDLTEEELMTCESTAQFEDFILIFFDRLFVIIESSVQEHIRLESKESDGVRSKTDNAMEIALSSVVTPIVMQCSPKIFKEALRKFKMFATESTFEPNVAGRMVGILLRVFTRGDAEVTLAAFMPKLCEELRELLMTDEALHEENPPRDLMYRLLLLSRLVECNGRALLKYVPDVISVLDRALKLHNTSALSLSCEILDHTMTSLSCIELKEWRSSPKDYSAAPEKWLPVREWGYGCRFRELNFKWQVPGPEEAEAAQMILDRYLKPEIVRLRQWLGGERDMSRERRIRSFNVISAVFSSGNFLPMPNEEPAVLIESQVPATNIPLTRGAKHEITVDGENVRVALTRLLVDVQARMLADKSDDTRGLDMLIQVWERIVVMKIYRPGPPLEARLRAFAVIERSMDGRGHPKGNVKKVARNRMLAADALKLHDESRLDLVCESGITPSALKGLEALTELSVNTYSMVRLLAQIRLYWMLSHYPYSYRAVVPKLVEILNKGGEGDEWHARHKGVLYILLGPRAGPLLAKQDWETILAIWPAVLKAPLSEKPSILRLEHVFSETIHRHFPTVNTRLVMSESAIDVAKCLLTDSQLAESGFVEQINEAIARETASSDKAERLYLELINELVDVIETPNVQWRRLELALELLTCCPSLQTNYPPRAVRAIVQGLIHDDVVVRRTALRLTHYALIQRKRKLHKILVDPYEIAGIPRPDKSVPGYRKDLEWAMWSDDDIPTTDEEWDKPFLRNLKYGFYAWPEKVKVAAPISEQECSKFIPPEEMEEGERYLFEFFNDDAILDRFVRLHTVEEKKGKDKFNVHRYFILKMAFSQFGPSVAMKLITRSKELASNQQEACQRFSAEVTAASLKAPKYWKRQDALTLYNAALEVLSKGLSAVTTETMEDWGTCIATGAGKLDPRRGAVLLKGILDLCVPAPVRGDSDTSGDTSFSVCAKLFVLQGLIISLKWRIAPLAVSILKQLDAANFLQHPYQIVREHVGALLMTIFDTEFDFPGGQNGYSPKLAKFIESIRPRLHPLYDENGDIVIKSAASVAAGQAASHVETQEMPVALPLPLTPLTKAVANSANVVTEGADVDSSPDRTSDDPPQVGEGGEMTESEASSSRGSELINKTVVSRLQSSLRLTGDAVPTPPAPKDYVCALNLLTTVTRCCIGIIAKGANGGRCIDEQGHWCKPAYALVREACACSSRGSPAAQEELPRASATLLAIVSVAHHSSDEFDFSLNLLGHLADGHSWWARLACLDFAQPLLFYGLPWLCADPERAECAEEFTLKLMRDPRLEVRQSAAKLLTGLMHCRALQNEERTIKSLMKSCKSKELVERHRGVLGLCAYVSSRPYSIGSKLGDVLNELARHTNAPDPIPATIRLTLADFRRTHQDDWTKHRDQLTEEELDLLADLTSPPSYCA